MRSLALAALVALVAPSCGRRATPAPTASATVEPAKPPPPTSAELPPPPSAVASSAFGPWVRCYARFRPESSPLRDVTRLAMLCGPQNGMRQLGETLEGDTSDSGAPVEQALSLTKGQCVRSFAVADPGVADLDLALVSPSGVTLAADGIDDRWPVLLPDRAVCVDVDGRYVVRVRAKKGRGRFALSTWLLP